MEQLEPCTLKNWFHTHTFWLHLSLQVSEWVSVSLTTIVWLVTAGQQPHMPRHLPNKRLQVCVNWESWQNLFTSFSPPEDSRVTYFSLQDSQDQWEATKTCPHVQQLFVICTSANIALLAETLNLPLFASIPLLWFPEKITPDTEVTETTYL